jgi:hypothetical protein
LDARHEKGTEGGKQRKDIETENKKGRRKGMRGSVED